MLRSDLSGLKAGCRPGEGPDQPFMLGVIMRWGVLVVKIHLSASFVPGKWALPSGNQFLVDSTLSSPEELEGP